MKYKSLTSTIPKKQPQLQQQWKQPYSARRRPRQPRTKTERWRGRYKTNVCAMSCQNVKTTQNLALQCKKKCIGYVGHFQKKSTFMKLSKVYLFFKFPAKLSIFNQTTKQVNYYDFCNEQALYLQYSCLISVPNNDTGLCQNYLVVRF